MTTTGRTKKVALMVPDAHKNDAEDVFAQMSGNPADADGAISVRLTDDGTTITHWACNTHMTPQNFAQLANIKGQFPGSDFVLLAERLESFPNHDKRNTFDDALAAWGLAEWRP